MLQRVEDLKSVLSELKTRNHEEVYISIYLPIFDDEGLHSVRSNFRELISQARDLLPLTLTMLEREELLEPIQEEFESMIMQNPRRGMAFFRSRRTMHAVPLPYLPPKLTVVASSYHIKPLLRCLTSSPECTILTVTSRRATIFRMDKSGVHKLKEYPNEELMASASDHVERRKVRKISHESAQRFLKGVAKELTNHQGLQQETLVLLGPRLWRKWLQAHLSARIVENILYQGDLMASSSEIRKCIYPKLVTKEQAKIHKTIADLSHSAHTSLISHSLQDIALGAIQGRIDKLIVDPNVVVWGQYDREQGAVSTHTEQRDHRDDCVIDDIIEEVLTRSGRVFFTTSMEARESLPLAAVFRW